MQKKVSINFYNDSNQNEFALNLQIDNILFFRDILVKKIKGLKIKPETMKLMKGQKYSKRLTAKEIHYILNKKDNTDEIEKITKDLYDRIKNKNEINDYTVNTFTTLCGKAIEIFSSEGNTKHKEFLDMMKNVLCLEEVNKLTIEDQKEREEGAKESLEN